MIRASLSMLLSMALLFAQDGPGVLPSKATGICAKPQEFIFNNRTEPKTLDPAMMKGVAEFRLYMALFEGLVVPNAKTSQAEPGLAESWVASADLKTYTFKLREAFWSDGTPITAQDVVDSWLRTIDPETSGANHKELTNSIEGAIAFNQKKGPREKVKIQAVDPKTFEITFAKPMPHAIGMLTESCFGIVPMHVIKKYGKDWTKPSNFVGNGPYVLKEWNPNTRVVVSKNAKYWDAANVKLDNITFISIDGDADSYDKFKTGEFDWSPGIDGNRFDEIRFRSDFQNEAGSGTYFYSFNTNKKPFNDVKVRKALAMAIDRQVLCEKIAGTGQIPTNGFVPPMTGFKTTQGNAFNPEEARRLLAQAGYPGGKGFPKFQVFYNTLVIHEQIAEWIREQWKSILGIEAKLSNTEWEPFLHTCSRHDFDISRSSRASTYNAEPTNFLTTLRSKDDSNDGQYSNTQFDELLEQANLLPLGETRNKLLMQAEEIAITQDQAVIPLYFYPNQDLIDLSKWGGWHANTMGIHPWKAIYHKAMTGSAQAIQAIPQVANQSGDNFMREMTSYYQLDPRIGTGATGLCGPTSSADVIDYFSKRYPNLKPANVTGFDLIRMFAKEEGTGQTTGTTDLSVEVRLCRYIKKAGYKAYVTKLGISTNGYYGSKYTKFDISQIKEALLDEDNAILIVIGGYNYDQINNDYIRSYGHFLVLKGYDKDALILADPAKSSNQSRYRLMEVSHQNASLLASNKKYVLCHHTKGLYKLERNRWYHDIIESVIVIHISKAS